MWVTFRRVYHGWDIHRHGHARKKKKYDHLIYQRKLQTGFQTSHQAFQKLVECQVCREHTGGRY